MQKYTRSTFVTLFALGTVVTLQTACPADGTGDGDDTAPKEQLRIAAVYSDDGSGNNEKVEGIKLAAKDLNEAGVISKEIQIVPRLFNGETDRTQLAEDAINVDGAKAFISEFSSTAIKIARLTNTPEYENVVQCSGSSTNTKINNPNTPDGDDGIGADRNDTLFRSVSNDIKQAQLVWELPEDKGTTGFFYVGDSYGESFHSEIAAKAATDIGGLVYDSPFPTDLNLAELQPLIDDILAKNAEGKIQTLIVVGLPEHGGPIFKALVEAPIPFAGTIIATDGMVDEAVFLSQTGAFTQWLARAGNALFATTPENNSGDNSAQWLKRFQESTGIAPSSNFLTSHADCMYSYAIALIEADVKGKDPAAFLKQGLINQKQENLAGDVVVEVTPNVDGLKAARAAFLEGKKVRLNGASGRIEYDNDGDRAVQFYAVMQAVGSGPYEWERDQVWDPVSNVCVEGCD